jgi:hypothetical protein
MSYIKKERRILKMKFDIYMRRKRRKEVIEVIVLIL